MARIIRPILLISFAFWLTAGFSWSIAASEENSQEPIIGAVLQTFALAQENTDVRGLAFDDTSPRNPRLFALDASGRVFVYETRSSVENPGLTLELAEVHNLPLSPSGHPLQSPRGLAFAVENGTDVLYFLNWTRNKGETHSQLCRWKPTANQASFYDLSLFPFRIGNRELFDIAVGNGNVFVSFDALGYKADDLRVSRGIIHLEWDRARDGQLQFVKHMPDSGQSPSWGLTVMEWERARYLWGTVGNEAVYSAEGSTGRGLFHFPRPKTTDSLNTARGLAYGLNDLWVPETSPGPDLVHRVNVTRNPDASFEGPRILRRLVMSIETVPEKEHPAPGAVFHHYSRPYANAQMPNQGIWVESETITDASAAPGADIRRFHKDPAGDGSARQHMFTVLYPEAPARSYASRYEIDVWTNPYRKYIYPHRVARDTISLEGTDYLADDPDLYNLSDKKTYEALFLRVRNHIEVKYGVAADLDNPYWAARNVLEYFQDVYHYPSRPKRVPAAVDYDRGHFDANPGNLKIELSERPYDRSQIIACSGTSVMLGGAMRYLGIPSRWLGTGTEQPADTWDTNGNGLLDPEETASCSNGHRYNQVWLGHNYGWICFDATPTKPDEDDYDVAPRAKSQWTYMNRAAAGHLKDKRIVFNVGSGLIRELYRDFEFDEDLAVDNNCGGDQRYNLQGRFEKNEHWKLASHRIAVKNLCFIDDIRISGSRDATVVTWKARGAWDRDPSATVSISLHSVEAQSGFLREISMLLRDLPFADGRAVMDLSRFSGQNLRILIRKDGDAQTGGVSDVFSLEPQK